MDYIDYYSGNYTFDNDIDKLIEKLPSDVKDYMSVLLKKVKTLLALCRYSGNLFFVCEHGYENPYKLTMEFMIGDAKSTVEFTMTYMGISLRIEFQQFKLMTMFNEYDNIVKIMDFFFDKSKEYEGRVFPIEGELTYGNELRALTNDFGQKFSPRSR